ncbi:MAG: fructosamine kinase family protein [Planctomycetes bacterium]|nr:fructosamine kinase family protein [Planctomycetota bacterium]
MPELSQQIEAALGQVPVSLSPLAGGCVGDVQTATLADGSRVVVKVDASAEPSLDIEGFMLSYLARESSLPVPRVLHADDRLLIMTHVAGSSTFDAPAQRHAAELLAELHAVTAPRAGLDRDTLIGSLHQPNPWTESWVAFFAAHRLVYMADEAARAGRLPADLAARVHALADRLDGLLDEPDAFSLVHGDVWSGNVLAEPGRITGFIDPAIYYAHPEVELAFITLFNCFGQPFFDRYHELRPIAAGFFESRRHVYNLYPLLVHVRLFGGGYVQQLSSTLSGLGF